MKKVIAIVALVLLLAGAFFYLQQRQAANRVRGVTLAPPETLFFVHLPDLSRTAERWPRTSLNQLLREPEVQEFLAKPKEKLPWMAEGQVRLEQLTQAVPREAFVAVTSMQGNTPVFVAGLCFDGNRTALQEMLTDAKAAVRNARPAGKADIVVYAGTEIETYTDKDFAMVEAFRDNWYFVSNQLELLQKTIDRYDGTDAAEGRFAAKEQYVKAMEALPKDADLVLYGEVKVLADRLAALLATAGQNTEGGQIAALQEAEAIAASVKMDDTLIRDTVFIMTPNQGKATPLARRSLQLSTADTLLYYAASMGEGGDFAKSAAPMLAALPDFNLMEAALAADGMKVADFGEIFGPESGVLLDWPLVDAQPTVLLTMDVRDPGRAPRFLDALAAANKASPAWTRRDENGATMYIGPGMGLLNVAPVIGLTRDFAILGFSAEAVQAGLKRQDAGGVHVDQTGSYQQAVGLVSAPTSAFAFLNTQTLFERIYGIVRPFLAMSMAFSPEAGEYFDAGKLPTTDAIVRHLGPSTFSQTQVENGTLVESAGTITVNQAVLGAVVGIGTAALPVIQQMNQPGGAPGILPPGFPQNPAAPGAPGSPFPLPPGLQIPPPPPAPPSAPEAPVLPPEAPTEA